MHRDTPDSRPIAVRYSDRNEERYQTAREQMSAAVVALDINLVDNFVGTLNDLQHVAETSLMGFTERQLEILRMKLEAFLPDDNTIWNPPDSDYMGRAYALLADVADAVFSGETVLLPYVAKQCDQITEKRRNMLRLGSEEA